MNEHNQNERGNKPVDVLRDGALKVSIFRNRGESGDTYAMVPSRIYTDKETGDVREATSFSAGEALRMANLMTKGYERVVEHKAETKENSKEQHQKSQRRNKSFEQER